MSKREFLKIIGMTAVAGAVPEIFDKAVSRAIKVELQGRAVWLHERRSSGGIVSAQFGYQHPTAYFAQYQMWVQWSQMQYMAHMQRMAMQYAWTQAYMAAMGSYMQQYSANYRMSEPFAMDSVRSLYSFAQGGSGNAAVIGLNRYQDRVNVTGRGVPLMSALADIADDEGWADSEMERSSGPQSSSSAATQYINGNAIDGTRYQTANGNAFASRQEFTNRETGDSGSIVVFNSKTGTEQRLVPLYS